MMRYSGTCACWSARPAMCCVARRDSVTRSSDCASRSGSDGARRGRPDHRAGRRFQQECGSGTAEAKYQRDDDKMDPAPRPCARGGAGTAAEAQHAQAHGPVDVFGRRDRTRRRRRFCRWRLDVRRERRGVGRRRRHGALRRGHAAHRLGSRSVSFLPQAATLIRRCPRAGRKDKRGVVRPRVGGEGCVAGSPLFFTHTHTHIARWPARARARLSSTHPHPGQPSAARADQKSSHPRIIRRRRGSVPPPQTFLFSVAS